LTLSKRFVLPIIRSVRVRRLLSNLNEKLSLPARREFFDAQGTGLRHHANTMEKINAN
jgi:hypothetical protein